MNKTTNVLLEPPIFLHDVINANPGEGQCDCACVATVPLTRTPTAVPPHTPYTLTQSFSTIPVNEQYQAIVSSQITGVVINHSALALARHFTQPRPLVDIPAEWRRAWGETAVQNTLDQFIAHSLLVPAAAPQATLEETATTLSAWLHITDRCNLRCDYCYLPHKREDLSWENGRAALEGTFRSAVTHGYQTVKLKYAGGEPLIRFPFVAELHQYAQTLAQQHGLALDGVVLSNGTRLTTDIIAAMQALGLRLMISLDGLGETHDSQRIYADGRGSFADVARSIDLALAYGLIPDISVTVSGRSAAGLADLLVWILQRNLPFSLNFYRENELSASRASLRLEEEQIIAGMEAAFAAIEADLPQRSLLASLVDRANLSTPHQRTCGVGHSYLVFDHHGRVSKCQMHQEQTVTTVLAEDPLAQIRADQIGIQNLPAAEKEGCRDCEWQNWCAGGCPLATYRATGRYDIQSPNCNIYKTLYPQAVRLEGLRLLQQPKP
ncbi:MAG: SPASM domain-containing protein [Chloroflexi bacterium]|nr:SPASM domain-containing protein [Chloroflexota bacterium]